ncbi:hypothetical protein J3R30DRAFT_3579153 [Lentinula aciculospora]|uniref:SNTX MACPF/CDC-like domain-containing protein n=1 Tax=Lentinula aciculospora TaxID=153920 RepID=A0A9W8ZW50_9AGAR|nr:hypothetical protein J3R30DRAFT_3579153 [Lentinula aciculospora]
MGFRSEEMDLPALGRPAFLGQLYNATSERLMNTQLFGPDLVSKVQTVPNSSNSVKFKDINTISDRANALDIKAELSVSIMSGLIDLKGSGQYLDTSKSNVSSREVSMICSTRKNLKRLDLKGSDTITAQTYERAAKHGATHVVTGIIYGGTLVTNVVEKASLSEAQTKIHGEFTASLMKKMASKFSAEGKASVDSDKTSKDVLESRDFDFYGDYAASGRPNAMTIGDLFELAKKWPELVGEGVPCQITVTPLDQFVDGSIEAKILHELESDELAAILTAYDEIFRLAGRRTRIQAALEAGNGNLGACCPTFMDSCKKRKIITDGILGRSRQALGKYLVAFRDGGSEKAGKTTTEFVDAAKVGLADHLKECGQDESVLSLLQNIQDLAVTHGVPLETLNGLRSLMTRANQGMLGVVLIPPSPNLDGAINAYEVLVAKIKKWRVDEDKKDTDADGKTKETLFISFYCDPALVSEFLDLDGKKGVLKKALEGFEKSKGPRFVHYGILPTSLSSVQKQIDWSLLNDEGWAFVHNETENSYYVGQVSGGKRHGRGTVTYANGSTYSGDWWYNQRHGEGELVEKTRKSTGVFINDQYWGDGVVVDLTILAHHVTVGAAKIPLRKRDAGTAHVRMIGTMLEWKEGEEYKLVVEAKGGHKLEMIVVGKLIRHDQDDMFNKSWPLDESAEIKVEKRS